ncbi:putative DNA binding domain-containing protein [Vibrio mimicus]
MYIKSLKSRGYSVFPSLEISFVPNDLNVIQGQNASGKTQIFGALRACIEGEKCLNRGPFVEGDFLEVELVENGREHLLGYQVNHLNKLTKTSEENAFIKEVHESIAFSDMPCIFIDENHKFNASNILQSDVELGVIERFKDCLGEDIMEGFFSSSDKVHSNSLSFIYLIVNECLLRLTRGLHLPLVLDCMGFEFLDEISKRKVLNLLKLHSDSFQTIVFASQACELQPANLVLDIKPSESKGFGSIFYKNNGMVGHQAKLQKTVTKLNPGYHLGAELKKDENLETEYKEVKGNNAVNSIKDIADQYIVAFLNSPQLKQGRILWGVTDTNREVVGVSLNYSQRDDLRRNLVNKLHDIQPTIPPSCYRVEFKPVYLKNKPVNDLYVLEVSVSPFESEFLFCTTKKEVFIKTDGGKRKLSPYEIQLEYRDRIKKYS